MSGRRTPTITFRCPDDLRVALLHVAAQEKWSGSISKAIVLLLHDAIARRDGLPAGVRDRAMKAKLLGERRSSRQVRTFRRQITAVV